MRGLSEQKVVVAIDNVITINFVHKPVSKKLHPG